LKGTGENGNETRVALPLAAWDHSDRGEEIDEPGAWWVVVPLWSIASRMSSLSIEAIVRDEGGARGVGTQSATSPQNAYRS